MGNRPLTHQANDDNRRKENDVIEQTLSVKKSKVPIKLIEEPKQHTSSRHSACSNNGNFILPSPINTKTDLEELKRRLNGLSPQNSRCNSRRGSSVGCVTPKRSGTSTPTSYQRRNLGVIVSGCELEDDATGTCIVEFSQSQYNQPHSFDFN